MIDVHYWPTPNGWKITIMLEECGLAYRIVPVNIERGEQFRAEFLAISPNNRMPAMVDHEPHGGGRPLAVFESGAMLQYLGEKSGKLLPSELSPRYEVLQWVTWQVANLGPMAGQVAHFCNYARLRIDYAIDRYRGELERLLAVLDRRLRDRRYIAGDYSIADIASFSWVRGHRQLGIDLDAFPNLRRWHDELAARDAVRRGVEVGKDLRQGALDEEARRHLFGQNAATVLCSGAEVSGAMR